MQLIIHTLQNPSLPGFSGVLPHEFNSLLHTCAELGARLPVWILILVNHEIFRPVSRVVDLFETPRTNPSWIFHNKGHMLAISVKHKMCLHPRRTTCRILLPHLFVA